MRGTENDRTEEETLNTQMGPTAETQQQSFLKRHGQKLAALFFWVALLGGYQVYVWRAGLSPLEAVQGLIDFMGASLLGPLIYIASYAVRPLILFPASLLTVAAGFVFGPVLGVVLTVVASNTSATVAYLVGRFFGGDLVKGEGVVQRYARRLRQNSFETVLTMRFIFLPFDFVNYLAGFLKINWGAFILATILGSLPGTLAFVLFGASIEMNFTGGTPSLNPGVLVASAVIFVASIAISQIFKRRERHMADTPAPATGSGMEEPRVR